MEIPASRPVEIEQIFDAIKDPVIERFYRDIKETARVIDEVGGATNEDRAKFINEFDSRWPHLGKLMCVSGSLYEPQGDELNKVACDDRAVVSNGFAFAPDHIMIDDEVVVEHYRLVHHLGLLNEEGVLTSYGYAHLDEITCDYSEDSTELSKNRLELHFPDLIDDIDMRMCNASDDDEAVLSLTDLAVVGDPDNNDYRLAVIDMQQYIDQLADFDTEIPYYLEAVGPFVAQDESGVLGYSSEDEMISGYVMSHGVRFVRTIEQPVDGTERLVAHLWCTYHGPSREDKHMLWVPIANLYEYYSLRKNYAVMSAESEDEYE